MTFFVLAAFYRNQQLLDENPEDFFAEKFIKPEELKFGNVTSDQFVVMAVIVKGNWDSTFTKTTLQSLSDDWKTETILK